MVNVGILNPRARAGNRGLSHMILIGIGANLKHPRYGPPRATCEAALQAIADSGLRVLRRSRWYRSAPVPISDQPWFVNGVAILGTELDPAGVLEILHKIEVDFGRVRERRDEARVLDLDLLAYGTRVSEAAETPILPHPRLAERAFVLKPLAELVPDWRHPVTGASIQDLLRDLPANLTAEPMD